MPPCLAQLQTTANGPIRDISAKLAAALATIRAMGQPVRVAQRPSAARPGTVQFETNRPLTGAGHRHYRNQSDAASAEDPADLLAFRLFERGGIDHLHVYGNIATVDLQKGHSADGIVDIIEELFAHYR